MLVGVGIDPQQAVGRPLEPQVALGGVDPGEVATQERDRHRQRGGQDEDLQDGRSGGTHRSPPRSSRPSRSASPAKEARVSAR